MGLMRGLGVGGILGGRGGIFGGRGVLYRLESENPSVERCAEIAKVRPYNKKIRVNLRIKHPAALSSGGAAI